MSVSYPPKDFLRDFDEWTTKRLHPSGFENAKILFSIRYPQAKTFSYRFNLFVCILQAVHGELPALIHDRIAKSDGGASGGASVPEDLLLALDEWYCSLTEKEMDRMPDPEWSEVLPIFDRRWKE